MPELKLPEIVKIPHAFSHEGFIHSGILRVFLTNFKQIKIIYGSNPGKTRITAITYRINSIQKWIRSS